MTDIPIEAFSSNISSMITHLDNVDNDEGIHQPISACVEAIIMCNAFLVKLYVKNRYANRSSGNLESPPECL